MRQSRQDQTGGFVEVWTRHAPDLYRACLRWTSGRRDLAQEGLARAALIAVQKYSLHRPAAASVRAWLFQLARNACMEIHRERRRHSVEPLVETSFALRSVTLPDARPEETTPERSMLLDERRAVLRRAIAELPPRLRVPLELHVLDGMSYLEVARSLGLLDATLRKRMQQARDALRNSLEDYQRRGAGPAAVPAPPGGTRRQPRDRERSASGESLPEVRSLLALTIEPPQGRPRDLLLWLDHPPAANPKRRLATLYRYIERHPGGWKGRYELALVLRQSGRPAEAAEELRAVVARQPRFLPGWLLLGESLALAGRRVEAEAVWREGAREAVRPAVREHFAGLADAAARRYPAAVEALRRAVAAGGTNLHRLALATLELALGWPVQAAETLTASLAADPEDDVARSLRLPALLALDRPLEAREEARRLLDRVAVEPRALACLARLRIAARRVRGEEAIETCALLDRLRAAANGRMEARCIEALFHLARGEVETARSVAIEAVRHRPTHPRAWLLLAHVCSLSGDPDGAVQPALHALGLDPDDPWPCRDAAGLLAAVSPAAAADLRRRVDWMARRFAHDPAVLASAASLWLIAGGSPERARELSAESVRAAPDLARAWLDHGRLLVHLGPTRDAIQALERGWGALPDDDSHHTATSIALALAGALAASGEIDAARQWFGTTLDRAGLLLSSEPPAAHAARGDALVGLGERAAAIAAYQAALDACLLQPRRAAVAAALDGLRLGDGKGRTPRGRPARPLYHRRGTKAGTSSR